MANQPSPTVEELQLRKRARRRLIGAITLVVLMVTVLPMILDDEPKPVGQDIAINIPSPQGADAPFKAAPAPVPAQPSPSATLPPPTQPAASVEPKKPVAVVEKATLEPKPKPDPVAKEDKPAEKPKEAKPVAKVPEPQQGGASYVVLLGAFLGEANARQRQAKLKELGVKFYVENIKSPAGDKTAVRAGPYPSRQDAEHALAKLKSAGIQDGMVAEKK